jgi:hypothetical protein
MPTSFIITIIHVYLIGTILRQKHYIVKNTATAGRITLAGILRDVHSPGTVFLKSRIPTSQKQSSSQRPMSCCLFPSCSRQRLPLEFTIIEYIAHQRKWQGISQVPWNSPENGQLMPVQRPEQLESLHFPVLPGHYFSRLKFRGKVPQQSLTPPPSKTPVPQFLRAFLRYPTHRLQCLV